MLRIAMLRWWRGWRWWKRRRTTSVYRDRLRVEVRMVRGSRLNESSLQGRISRREIRGSMCTRWRRRMVEIVRGFRRRVLKIKRRMRRGWGWRLIRGRYWQWWRLRLHLVYAPTPTVASSNSPGWRTRHRTCIKPQLDEQCEGCKICEMLYKSCN